MKMQAAYRTTGEKRISGHYQIQACNMLEPQTHTYVHKEFNSCLFAMFCMSLLTADFSGFSIAGKNLKDLKI